MKRTFKNLADMNTKIFTFAIILFLLLGSVGTFAQQPIPKKPSKKGNFNYGLRYGWRGDEIIRQYGENSKEALDMYFLAMDEYKKCIQNGKKLDLAHHYLGQLYYRVPMSSKIRNYDQAMFHLSEAEKIYLSTESSKKRAEDLGLLPLLYNDMGNIYYGNEDLETALSYYKRYPASFGSVTGMAWLYWLGLGVEQDLSKALEGYKTAASKFGQDVWANIYYLEYQIKEYEKGNYDNKSMRLFLDYLYLKSMGNEEKVWMEKLIQSADLGYPPAQVDLWIIYRDRKEFSTGMPYLQKAVDANFVPALFHLGYVYHMGIGTKTDYLKAQKLYEKAAVNGHPLAQSNLGTLYFSNLISAPQGYSNKELAYYWWNVSANQGYSVAIYNKTLVETYRAPQSNFENIIQIVNSIAGIMNTSMDIYNNINKSKIQIYNPGINSTASNQIHSNASFTNTAKPAQSGTDYCNDPYYTTLKNTDQRTYNNHADAIMNMNYGLYPFSKGFSQNDRQSRQSKMKQIRQKWESRGCTFHKSDWEDWNGVKK